jgi:glycogenin glucosyltransferase
LKPPQYVPGQPYIPPSATVQQHVFGEATNIYGGVAPERRIAPPSTTDVAPAIAPPSMTQPPAPVEVPTSTVEEPFTEPVEQAEAIDQGIIEPAPTVEQRRFSAPQMEWDATRLEILTIFGS